MEPGELETTSWLGPAKSLAKPITVDMDSVLANYDWQKTHSLSEQAFVEKYMFKPKNSSWKSASSDQILQDMKAWKAKIMKESNPWAGDTSHQHSWHNPKSGHVYYAEWDADVTSKMYEATAELDPWPDEVGKQEVNNDKIVFQDLDFDEVVARRHNETGALTVQYYNEHGDKVTVSGPAAIEKLLEWIG